MSNTNQRYNQAMMKKFRKELKSLLDDIGEIDKIVLNKSVNSGVRVVKELTPVGQYTNGKVGGFMKKSWRATPAYKSASGEVIKILTNSANYSSFVNYGHRVVNRSGETVGYVKGKFMLEKAIGHIDKQLVKNFEKEVERVNREHDK